MRVVIQSSPSAQELAIVCQEHVPIGATRLNCLGTFCFVLPAQLLDPLNNVQTATGTIKVVLGVIEVKFASVQCLWRGTLVKPTFNFRIDLAKQEPASN